MKSKNPVVWFEIYVDDLKRAQIFYETVLGLALSALPTPTDVPDEMMMLAFPMEMDGDGAGGALIKMKGVKAGGNSTVIYFRSEDCAREEAKVESAGGKLFQSKQSLGEHGFMILASDTEGNTFGVHSLK